MTMGNTKRATTSMHNVPSQSLHCLDRAFDDALNVKSRDFMNSWLVSMVNFGLDHNPADHPENKGLLLLGQEASL